MSFRPILSFLIAFLCCSVSADVYSQVERKIEAGLTVEIEAGKKIYVKACPTEDCDIGDWTTRVLADPEHHARFTTAECLRAPLAQVAEQYQLEAIKTLFRNDSHDQKDWIHKVTYVSSGRQGGETLWSISGWFTGDPQNYQKIFKHNHMSRGGRLYKGTTVRIPLDLLSPAFKEPILSDIAARRALRSFSAESKRLNGNLILKTDSQGPYASYQLKKGDTIYSKVVMKFTDRVTAEDVMDAVKIICDRSNIKKPRKLKAGDEVKVPLELLSPMYLPKDDPRRQAYEKLREETASYSNPVRTADLMGIIVILDAGHGGNDPGATGKNEIYEDEAVYDIMCRIKRLLETTTMAEVIPTVVDKSEQYEPQDVSYFPNDTDEYVLTNPVYKNGSSKVSANLRWYLVNSIFRKVTAEGADPDKVVFVSLHADSLYHEARGTMVYIPGTYYCKGNGGKSGYVYTSRSEVREKQYVRLSYKDRVRSEGLSSQFAKHLIGSLSRHGIMVHSEKPIRNHVVRRRHAWVPAVIRYNIVPTKVLIEVANLNNSKDSSLVGESAFREKYARAFVEALKEYYGGK